nr:MAG TPA: hypothetical protein [Bacteriophage sp.]
MLSSNSSGLSIRFPRKRISLIARSPSHTF